MKLTIPWLVSSYNSQLQKMVKTSNTMMLMMLLHLRACKCKLRHDNAMMRMKLWHLRYEKPVHLYEISATTLLTYSVC